MTPSLSYYLIVVEGFACPNDPRCSVVGAFMPLVGSPMANRSGGRGQTKGSSKRPLMMSQAWGWGSGASAWWPAFAHGEASGGEFLSSEMKPMRK